MIGINGKSWHDLTATDVKCFVDDTDQKESFFFEFKTDDVRPNKVIREITAFANTYGGYIFIGLTDTKDIYGCSQWTEERLNTTIKDCITPIPIFDIKQFTIDGKLLLVLKVDEGPEPPYVTNKGEILIRISSSTSVITDSSKLSWLIHKSEHSLEQIEKRISIPKIQENLDIIFGYIDIGFTITIGDVDAAKELLLSADLDGIAAELSNPSNTISLYRMGDQIVYSSGSISSNGFVPVHMHNFLIILPDGSAKMRLLIFNNNLDSKSVNLGMLESVLSEYKKVYKSIMGSLLPDKFIYAKRYEELTVLKQFQPIVIFETQNEQFVDKAKELNNSLDYARKLDQKQRGVFTALTDSRIPPTGLQYIDKEQLEKWSCSYTCDDIIDSLIHSSFMLMSIGNNQQKVLESIKDSDNRQS